jgi:hypothetical protein
MVLPIKVQKTFIEASVQQGVIQPLEHAGDDNIVD